MKINSTAGYGLIALAIVISAGAYWLSTNTGVGAPVQEKIAPESSSNPDPSQKRTNQGGLPTGAPTSPAQRPLELSLSERFIASTNLLDLVDSLRVKAAAGDAEAAGLIARAYDECFPYAVSKKSLDPSSDFFKNLEEPQKSIALAHRERQMLRCNALNAKEIVNTAAVNQLSKAARDLNDLTHQARSILEEPGKLTAAETAELSREIVSSKDAEAIAALAYSQGENPDDAAYQSKYSGTDVDVYSWLLVACDLGRDCASDGVLMRNQCLNMGICTGDNYREFIRSHVLTPAQYQLASTKEAEILSAINSGRMGVLFP